MRECLREKVVRSVLSKKLNRAEKVSTEMGTQKKGGGGRAVLRGGGWGVGKAETRSTNRKKGRPAQYMP